MNEVSETRFLTFEEVLIIHQNQVDLYGGHPGVRDENLLLSALAQPEMTFGDACLHESLAAKAGAYLFHIVANHPFFDGNKRTGLASALSFLILNGYTLKEDLDEENPDSFQTPLEAIVLAVASGNMSKEALILFIEQNIVSIDE